MYYPEQLTAELLAEHLGHEIIIERYGRDNYTYFHTVALALECVTCSEGLALEWADTRESETV